MRHHLPLIGFVVGVLAVGLAIGFAARPDGWYAALEKPAFNPPNWLFGPVWSVLYVVIGIAGWRLWSGTGTSTAMTLWWGQLILNYAWPPVFFGLHRIGLALVVILGLLMLVIAVIAAAWRNDRVAAWLLAPYALWVAFASLLNAAIWRLN